MYRHATKLLVAFGLAAFAIGCDIDQTREGRLPEVEVREGDMPAYDVDTAEIETGTRTDTVEVPDIDVQTREERVEMPTVDIQMPDEGEQD
ncbi:hypothetical protein [Sandaracinus amylolyticus]|uniref:Uncharacterized protein n=1 Tax=Sandaracinus amylolyticus TaxID=927083 RepID=A0A0F6W906_9BACT|nr:hypothetical protein [Sandaracinus amylolyticus]AKF10543.1 hypothetical protein DB32_007692 [Sandaracinus amylolyticus]